MGQAKRGMEKTAMRKVMIGTPCYDGRLDVWYTNSLVNTIKESYKHDVEITPIWVSFDALIQRARNDTIQIFLLGDYDDLIWIDSDIEWQPEWFFELLNYKEDVVGGTYRKKGDKEEYVIRQLQKKSKNENGLIEVDGLGTGFVKMSRTACQHLWDVSPPYIDKKDDLERKMIFDVQIVGNDLMSEDIWAFETLKKGGFKIWMDPKMTCNHIGPYKFKGDFASWYKSGLPTQKLTPPALMRQAIRKQL
jgi:glycosyltransferase involved in cell wall biosynthesis